MANALADSDHGPERLRGQGLDRHQEESGNRAIHALLTDPVVGDQVDLVLTWREADGRRPAAYEVWSRRGMVRFRRVIGDDGALGFETLEVHGVDPLANVDPLAINTLDGERAAAAASGFDPDDADRRFIAPEHQSYPFAHERIAQLFDSPHAPDLAVSPRDWCSGSSPGTHGGLHVRQARAPLWFSGPGVTRGRHQLAARSIDIAPTLLAAMRFPLIDGADATGRTSSERGVGPDVLLARQDGRVLDEVLDPTTDAAPARVYVFLLDGMHQTELEHRLATEPDSIPHLRRLNERAAVLAGGSIVNFPSITWPSHTAIGTGTWCGHHDVVNPSYYLRDRRETISPQGLQIGTERFSNTSVESIYEAFHRVHPDDLTAAIHAPFGRSARHAVLEGRNLCDRAMVKALTAELAPDMNPRWALEHGSVAGEALLDVRGLAQVLELFGRDAAPPRFVYHELALTDGAGHEYGPHSEGLREALDETDRRIGKVLALLDERGLFDDTLFVVSADHGMAPQDVTLGANPTAHVLEAGLAAVLAEPMIWLLDVAVEVERAADGRTGRVGVFELDLDVDDEQPPVEGAHVLVEAHVPGHSARLVARGSTDHNGLFGFATPSDVPTEHLVVSVRAEGFNPRHLRLDGTNLTIDLVEALYG